MKVEASVPAYLPTSTQQKYVKTTVVPQQDGSHKVNQVHYLLIHKKFLILIAVLNPM